MKRSAPLKRRAPMRRRSEKRRETYEREGGRRDVVKAMLRDRPECEAGEHIVTFSGGAWTDCQFWSMDVHEVQPRSQGGSIVDADNLLAVCRLCHGWIHEHPADAKVLGLLATRGDA